MRKFLADEDGVDRRTLLKLGSWGVGTVLAVSLAIMAAMTSSGTRRDQAASEELGRQAQRIERLTKESMSETRRLAAAVDTLNGDRDRVFSRLATLEQGLESVTGSIKRQAMIATPPVPQLEPPAVQIAPPSDSAPASSTLDRTPATKPPAPAASSAGQQTATPLPESATVSAAMPLMAPKSIMAPPDPSASRLIEPPRSGEAPVEPAAAALSNDPGSTADATLRAEERTKFGIDVGGASSIEGVRLLWQRLAKDKSMSGLRPIVVMKERPNAPGMQLRLVAGPLRDAAAAAKLCASLTAPDRSCEPAVFDGQSLASAPAATTPAASRPQRKRAAPPPPLPQPQPSRDNSTNVEPAAKPSALSILLGGR